MITKEIEKELRDALPHLHDPVFQPSEFLYELTSSDPQEGAFAVQSVIIQAIDGMKPPEDEPSNALVIQAYTLLRNRFLRKLTIEETAERMHMSSSSIWRAQGTAVRLLARSLWDKNQQKNGGIIADEEKPITQEQNWHAQMQRELASLHASSPELTADIGRTIQEVLDLMNAMVSKQGSSVNAKFIQPNLVGAVHPSLLRQMLIAALGRLLQYSPPGEIDIFANLEDGSAKITLSRSISADLIIDKDEIIYDLFIPEDISLDASVDGTNIFLALKVPSTGKVSVLVIDDNPDMIRFYQSSTMGTRYHIITYSEGENPVQTIKEIRPDIVVLDIMLPDVDGWQILMHIHEDPQVSEIPVIVCSVVREEELALSLGAASYLSKPVRRSEFIQALNQIIGE